MGVKLFFRKAIERYLFYPNIFDRIISLCLLPLTLIYCLIVLFKRVKNSQKIEFGANIISVGNLVVGGSGKTPVIIELAKNKKDIAIILRGYKRSTKGLIVVDSKKRVDEVGDEALLYKLKLPDAIVIVSEDRIKGIVRAIELGAKNIFLDDGFRFNNIKKFDILLRPKNEPTNEFCLPSGGYKEPKGFYSIANLVLTEGIDFKREVFFVKENKIINKLPKEFILLSAISKPERLLEFIPKPKAFYFFPDHYKFKKRDIENILKKHQNLHILTTYKDYVKLKEFNIKNLIIIDLKIKFLKEFNYDL